MGGEKLSRAINKVVAALMTVLMTTQNLVLWPPCEARQNEAGLSLRAVASLPRAVGMLPDATGESDSGENVHRCRSPDSRSGTKGSLCFGVNVGYRARDEPLLGQDVGWL